MESIKISVRSHFTFPCVVVKASDRHARGMKKTKQLKGAANGLSKTVLGKAITQFSKTPLNRILS